MAASRKRIFWVGFWLLLAGGLGTGLVEFLGQPPPVPPASQPNTPVAITTIPQSATLAATPVIQTYGELLHADLPNYPATQPWAISVELSEAAHVVIPEPVYVCSRGHLWITRKGADPLPVVLARATNESEEHIINSRVEYIFWSISRRGQWQAAAICRDGNQDEMISPAPALPRNLPTSRPFHWDSALTWIDGDNTRMIVPTDTGISIITPTDAAMEESYFPLISAPVPGVLPQVVFDARGILAWVPADNAIPTDGKVARFVDGKWNALDPADWPSSIIHMIPTLDGSVLQIRRAADAGTVELTVQSLEKIDVDEKKILALAAQLEDDNPDKRVEAYQQLSQYGPGAYPILEKYLPSAGPEGQARIGQLLAGRLAARLGGLSINENKLSVAKRLAGCNGLILFAPSGVTIPQGQQDPIVVSPDYLLIRPGHPVQEIPPGLVQQVSNPGNLNMVREELVLTTDDGPQEFLPPAQLFPLESKSEKRFTNLVNIDMHGRWVFRPPDADSPTLLIDPTVPDPTPRLAIWEVDSDSDTGWNSADWPAISKDQSHWILNDHAWSKLDDEKERIITTATQPANPSGKSADLLLLTDPDGNQFFDGRESIIVHMRSGRSIAWPLPEECDGSAGRPAFLVRDLEGHYFLFNAQGKIARLRFTPEAAEPFAVEAVFEQNIPDFSELRRVWLDPAGRIDAVDDTDRMFVIFPSGQIPREIANEILPQNLQRSETQ